MIKCKVISSECMGGQCIIIITEGQVIPPEVNRASFKIENPRSCVYSVDTIKNIQFEKVKMEKIPKGLGELFKNIECLYITSTNLKTIEKEDLRQFPKLKILQIQQNLLESLSGDLFEFNKNLERIYFSENKIKYIGAELLDELPKLKYVNFQRNLNINVYCNIEGEAIKCLRETFLKDCQPPNSNAFNQIQLKVPKFTEDIEKFSKLEKFKDFTIKIDEVEFKVHKFVFAARSATFAEMIENNPDAEELKMTDISVEVFESILNYVYTDEEPKNIEIGREIFAAAGKLKIEGLKEISAQILINEMKDKDLDFLMANLNLGTKFECQRLKLRAFEEIKKHFPGKKLKDELLDQPENLKELIETKKKLDKFMEV